ncbi:MAG: hypothetical protein LBS74_02500 [Oscillospiraceae bacterium]|nr:hypothetical protein [Oscillospiraceae bacterium]
MNFSGFAGNQALKNRISELFSSNRFPHAVILEGEKGLGKKRLAYLLAQALVCTSGEEVPCGHCGGCVRAKTGNHPDIYTAEGSGKTGAIPVAAIRQLKEDAYILPSEAERKVYILPDADRTLPAAQNAFLKCFEEPPPAAVFIITCATSRALLDTIRSRGVILPLSELTLDEIRQVIDNPERDTGIVEAFRIFGGNAGKIAESLEDTEFAGCISISENILKALLSPKELDIVLASAPLEGKREKLNTVLELLAMSFRDALALSLGVKGEAVTPSPIALELAKKLPPSQLSALYEQCAALREGNNRFVNAALLNSYMCSSLRERSGH